MPGGTELIILAILVLVLFGAKRLPIFARGLGRSVKEFKDGKEGKDPDSVEETANKGK